MIIPEQIRFSERIFIFFALLVVSAKLSFSIYAGLSTVAVRKSFA
jgi:hypothetical protein